MCGVEGISGLQAGEEVKSRRRQARSSSSEMSRAPPSARRSPTAKPTFTPIAMAKGPSRSSWIRARALLPRAREMNPHPTAAAAGAGPSGATLQCCARAARQPKAV